MHLPDGVLSTTPQGMAVLAAGTAIAVAGTAIGLRRMDYQRMPQVALLSAAFFVVSFISVPLGATRVHLVLNGLVGLILGWAAFPAILIALVLQLVLAGFGGLTTLGVNTAVMALPGVVCHGLFRHVAQARAERWAALAGVGAGMGAYWLSLLLFAGTLLAAGAAFQTSAAALVAVQLPLGLVEGAVGASAVLFLRKVRPELLQTPLVLALPSEGADA